MDGDQRRPYSPDRLRPGLNQLSPAGFAYDSHRHPVVVAVGRTGRPGVRLAGAGKCALKAPLRLVRPLPAEWGYVWRPEGSPGANWAAVYTASRS